MTTIKFVATTQQVQPEVIWVDDMEVSISSVGISDTVSNIMDRVFGGDLSVRGSIHVIDDNKELANQMAQALNARYTKEMELMSSVNEAKEQVDAAIKAPGNKRQLMTNATEVVVPGKKSKKAGLAFFSKHSADIKNAQKAPEPTEEETKLQNKPQTKEEVIVNKETKAPAKSTGKPATKVNTTMGSARRQFKADANLQVNTNETVSSDLKVNGTTANKSAPVGRLPRATPITAEAKTKGYEGPWYLNQSRYGVLGRFEQIITDMADAELGISDIVLVNPQDITKYAKKMNLLVVIQIKANGMVFDFPIKQNHSSQSKSNLTSTSIGWVETKDGLSPEFGFYRGNQPIVSTTCTCGAKLKNVSSTNVYCPKCKLRHENAVISIGNKEASSTLEYTVEDYAFQTIPNITVPAEMLALVMAIAQYDSELDMHGVIQE